MSPDSPGLEGTVSLSARPANRALGQAGGMRPVAAAVELTHYKEREPPRLNLKILPLPPLLQLTQNLKNFNCSHLMSFYDSYSTRVSEAKKFQDSDGWEFVLNFAPRVVPCLLFPLP